MTIINQKIAVFKIIYRVKKMVQFMESRDLRFKIRRWKYQVSMEKKMRTETKSQQ